jgi:hypothetical protein
MKACCAFAGCAGVCTVLACRVGAADTGAWVLTKCSRTRAVDCQIKLPHKSDWDHHERRRGCPEASGGASQAAHRWRVSAGSVHQLLTAVQHELVADNEVEPLAGIGPLSGALEGRDAGMWREIEQEIERRNASGYDRAAELLSDLQALAAEEGSQGDLLAAWAGSARSTRASGSSSSG